MRLPRGISLPRVGWAQGLVGLCLSSSCLLPVGVAAQTAGGSGQMAAAASKVADAPKADDAVKAAELSSAPAATQIPFYARVLPLPAESGSVIAASGEGGRKELAKDATVRYRVEYSIDPRGLLIESSASGVRHGHVEFIALVYDGDGRTIDQDVKSVRATWSSPQFADAQRRGVRFEQEIRLPAKGECSLRVLVHDLLGDKIGAIDVPAGELKAQLIGTKAEALTGGP